MEKHECLVEVSHSDKGFLGEGTLVFGEGLFPRISFTLDARITLENGETLELVTAVSNKNTYTLAQCKYSHLSLYADYMFEGVVGTPNFDKIIVRYHEISEWFLHGQHTEGQIGESISWVAKSTPLSVVVSTPKEKFAVKSKYVGTSKVSGEETVIREFVEFEFSPLEERKFGLSDIKAKAGDLSCLFSLLIAYPVTIHSVSVRLQNGQRCHVHFPTFSRPERKAAGSVFWIKCFVQKTAIENKWQTIFDRFYKSQYREQCWSRLSGMQRYEGFWEYGILGYVSLLERYVIIFSQNKTDRTIPSASKTKLKNFRQSVIKKIPKLEQADFDKILEIANEAFANKPKGLTFEDRYYLAIKETDADITKIIALTDEDFDEIKEIRHAVAHGDSPNIPGNDLTKVSVIAKKIELLLTYWAFLDFGFTTGEFIESLNRTHSVLRLSAQLNDVHLNRTTGSAEFYQVAQKQLNALRSIQGFRLHPCMIKNKDGTLCYSEKYATLYKEWALDRSRPSGHIYPKDVLGIENESAQFVSHAYFECDDEFLEVFNMWIIDASQIETDKQDGTNIALFNGRTSGLVDGRHVLQSPKDVN